MPIKANREAESTRSERTELLPFAPPLIGEEEIAEVIDTLRSDWITTGPKVKRFEQEFADFVGSPEALAVSSCTGALHLALKVLGVGPGDKVITTPMSFCSSVHSIEHVGAQPVFVDVEPDTLNIDPAAILAAIETNEHERIKAILPVHMYGHPCNMQAIFEIARKYGLAVIEDAAHALPAKVDGRMIGSSVPDAGAEDELSSRHLTCFSFYATKNLTTAEGGMLTGSRELVEEARVWSLHGMTRDAWKRYSAEGSWYYEVVHPGFKYNMTDIQAAIGLHQLRRLPGFQTRREEIARCYNEAFSVHDELEIPHMRAGVDHAWHLYVLRLNLDRLDLSRSAFIEELRAKNIGTSVHFIPVHLQPYYRDKYAHQSEDFPTAYGEFQRMLSLPLYPRMSDSDVQDVIGAVIDTVGSHSKKN